MVRNSSWKGARSQERWLCFFFLSSDLALVQTDVWGRNARVTNLTSLWLRRRVPTVAGLALWQVCSIWGSNQERGIFFSGAV